MEELVFLGTGPVDGIIGRDKTGRFESSALIETGTTNILIDVTNSFIKQRRWISSIDAVLITHAHKDAIGGINQLVSWMGRKNIGGVPLFAHTQTIAKIEKRFPKADALTLTAIKSGRKFNIGEMIVIPFLVKHSIQPGFPTLGFHFSLNHKKLVYVSDVGGWDKQAERLMKDADILVIDGAMWGKKILSHLDIKEMLPKVCKFPVKKIIFTQIGRTAPIHEILQKEIKKICPKAIPAYDGMVVNL